MTRDDRAIAVELERLERRLLEPEVRRSATELEALLADEFLEIGASGRTWNKQEIIAALATDELAEATIGDFAVRRPAPELALVTYRLHSRREGGGGARRTLRSSLWVRRDGRWRLVFHQGTPSDGGGPGHGAS